MRTLARSHLVIAGLAALGLVVDPRCTGGSTTPSGLRASGGGFTSGLPGLNRGTRAPRRGGTLNMLGTSDVDYMDYNISYETVGALGQRMWLRGLYAYPAIPGRTTIPEPDLATGPPRISNGGTTYTVTIRPGARWDTSPFSPVTAADAVLGLKRSCNPAQPSGGLPDFVGLIRGMGAFCAESRRSLRQSRRSRATSTPTAFPASPGRARPLPLP